MRLTRSCLRSGDTVARWGGEEFVVLLPATDLNGALLIAEKIRRRIGVEHLDELVARADPALYEAKHRGRNQTVAA